MIIKRYLTYALVFFVLLFSSFLNSFDAYGYGVTKFSVFLLIAFLSFAVYDKLTLLSKIILFLLYFFTNFFFVGIILFEFANVIHFVNVFIGLFFIFGRNKFYFNAFAIFLAVLIDFVYVPMVFHDQSIIAQNEYFFKKLERSNLLDKNKRQFKFEEGAVYYLNFTFEACLPCRHKKIAVSELKEAFRNSPNVKILNIHSNEEWEDFDFFVKNSESDLHDVKDQLSKLYKIDGFPFDLIIDSKGFLVREYQGYDRSMQSIYVRDTYELIHNLIKKR